MAPAASEVLNYYVVSPTGQKVTVPEEVFIALKQFLSTERKMGKIEIECRNGGVMGVTCTERLK